jgi:hypothetical protein
MPTDIQQLRRENSYRAVIGRKGLVQLGHLSANAGIFLDKVHLNAHIPEIESGLHSRYSTAYDENFL